MNDSELELGEIIIQIATLCLSQNNFAVTHLHSMKEDLNHLCDISSVIRVEAADPPLDGIVPPRGRRRRRVPAPDHVLQQQLC